MTVDQAQSSPWPADERQAATRALASRRLRGCLSARRLRVVRGLRQLRFGEETNGYRAVFTNVTGLEER